MRKNFELETLLAEVLHSADQKHVVTMVERVLASMRAELKRSEGYLDNLEKSHKYNLKDDGTLPGIGWDLKDATYAAVHLYIYRMLCELVRDWEIALVKANMGPHHFWKAPEPFFSIYKSEVARRKRPLKNQRPLKNDPPAYSALPTPHTPEDKG